MLENEKRKINFENVLFFIKTFKVDYLHFLPNFCNHLFFQQPKLANVEQNNLLFYIFKKKSIGTHLKVYNFDVPLTYLVSKLRKMNVEKKAYTYYEIQQLK